MNILDTIVARKRIEAARLPARPVTAAILKAALEERGGARDFFAALRRPRDLGCLAPKARADLIALPIAPGPKDLYEEIVWHRRPVDWFMVNGAVSA